MPQTSQAPLGTPSLQARVSQSAPLDGALAPGACSLSTLEPSLFSGIDTTLPAIAELAPEASDKFRPLLEKIDQQLAEAQRLFSPTHPELTAPPLRLALAALDDFLHELANPTINDLPSDETYNLLHELRIKRTQLNNALVLAHGLTLSATLADSAPQSPLLTTQLHFAVSTRLSNNGVETIDFAGLNLQTREDPKIPSNFPQPMQRLPLAGGSYRTDLITSYMTPGLPVTRPYFSRPNIDQPFYNISDPALRNAPAAPNPLTALVTIQDHGVLLHLAATVVSSGSLTSQPVVGVPPLSISVSPSVRIVPPATASFALNAMLQNEASAPSTATALLRLPDGQIIPSVEPRFAFSTIDDQANASFNIPVSAIHDRSSRIQIVVSDGSQQFSEGFRPVGYPGLTYTNFYTPATTRIVPVDVTTAPNLNIAYLPGTGDDIPSALDQLGIHPHILTATDLTPAALKPYDAVILGVRAYEAHPELAAANPALNTYAANGGVVIAQYNTSRLPDHTGPYPVSLGHPENVVEEDAPVQILAATDPLLTWPNHITTADFDHWIEERGHGFMATWDPHYTALIETHDQGQQPQRGGLLIARTGRGAWIYLGLALYRQLPEGVPGAYRILANLISAAKNPSLRPTEAPTRSPIQVTK